MVRTYKKYEWKYALKWLIPTVITMLGVGLISCMYMTFVPTSGSKAASVMLSIGMVLTQMLFGFVAVAALILPLVMAGTRYSKHILSSQGYLTLSLPVETSTHILGKATVSLWSALIVLVVDVIIVISDITAAILRTNDITLSRFLSQFNRFFDSIVDYFGLTNVIAIGVEAVLAIILITASNILLVYACFTMGQQMISKHRILGGFLCMFIWYVIFNLFTSILSETIPLFIEDLVYFIKSMVMPGLFIHSVIAGILLLLFVFCAILFKICHNYIDNKLNLE